MSGNGCAPLDAPLTSLPGVGAERAALLGRLKLRTVGDLLLYRPRRYEDRRDLRSIASLQLNEPTTAHGRIVAQGVKWWRGRQRSVFEFVLDDGSGRLHCRWWNLPYMEKYFRVGDEVFVFGKVRSLKPRTMDHPDTEVLEAGEETSVHLHRIVPVYPLTEGLSGRWLRGLVWRTLAQSAEAMGEPGPESVPPDLPGRADAVRQLHFPDTPEAAERARQRLAFDELVDLQRTIQERRRRLAAQAPGLRCAGDNRLMKPFLATLGFRLTAAQTRVLREIRSDLGGPPPMRRLLQGDVGSGKTVVAACAALMAIEGGFDVALMAPTEILTAQHARNFSRWFTPLGIRVDLLTGSQRPDRDADAIAAGSPRTLTVGTHALLEADFAPARLGLVIIDEQHKFGVAQRERLVRKGRYPHLLVMTATPIPRTLGLTLYGDLDASVIDEVPAGRGRVRTFIREADRLPRVWTFVRARLDEGRQAYVVYPRIEEEPGAAGLKAVRAEFARLEKQFAPHRVALLHGRLSAEEKETVVGAFRDGRVAVLVTTSVIEVGLDVANATVMVIENAESYGLAQLHQLRGRIGRGAADAWCILVAAVATPEARARLKALEEHQDGFRIAELDLQLRGPGELLGQAQSGLPPFRFVELTRDLGLAERARQLVHAGAGSAPAAAPANPASG